MTTFLSESLLNSFPFVDVFCQFVTNITIYLTSAISSLYVAETPVISVISEQRPPVQTLSYDTLYDYLYFDEFQLKLLKGFLAFLICNILLIFICWRVFGKRICEKFMRPATSIAIEELRASVSKLKLPKEHSPRI